MRIGVFSVLFQNLSLVDALDKIKDVGATAVEVGSGGWPGNHHCKLDELLASPQKREAYLAEFEKRGMIISALSCHFDHLSPNKDIAKEADVTFKKSVELANMLKVPVVNTMSGLPGGNKTDTSPNWVTCPWPPHFLEISRYQWEDVGIPYWKTAAKFAADHGVKIGIEMHPGMLIYNVDTILRMRTEVGPALGANFDPSHLFWNGVDPVTAIRKLGDAIHHFHGKDCYVDPYNVAVNGCNDSKPYNRIPDRSWTFRSIGYGHDLKTWKDIVSALRMVGYDHVISIEHEDALMSIDEGLRKGFETLSQAVTLESPGEMFWA